MKIVVTGALGHIGSLLIRELPKWYDNPEIVMIDNMSAQRYCSLFNLPSNAKYHFYENDVMTMDLDKLIAGADAVVHLAAITNAAGSFEIKDKLEKENYLCAERVATSCVKNKVKMINLSSTSVYGTQNEVVDEDCTEEELKPQSPYAETKLREERLLQKLGAEQGLRFITCRFGTIFGTSPGMRFHTAINKFCWQAVVGQPITVWRTALHQKRPYLDLNDGMRAFRFILEKDLFDGRIYNVLTTNTTVNSIVDIIKSHITDVNIELVDTKIMNQLSYTVSPARFESKGFSASGNLEKQIASTIELLKNARSDQGISK